MMRTIGDECHLKVQLPLHVLWGDADVEENSSDESGDEAGPQKLKGEKLQELLKTVVIYESEEAELSPRIDQNEFEDKLGKIEEKQDAQWPPAVSVPHNIFLEDGGRACKPCRYFHSRAGCKNHASCSFCHMDHPECKRPSKKKRHMFKRLVNNMLENGASEKDLGGLTSRMQNGGYVSKVISGKLRNPDKPRDFKVATVFEDMCKEGAASILRNGAGGQRPY